MSFWNRLLEEEGFGVYRATREHLEACAQCRAVLWDDDPEKAMLDRCPAGRKNGYQWWVAFRSSLRPHFHENKE